MRLLFVLLLLSAFIDPVRGRRGTSSTPASSKEQRSFTGSRRESGVQQHMIDSSKNERVVRNVSLLVGLALGVMRVVTSTIIHHRSPSSVRRTCVCDTFSVPVVPVSSLCAFLFVVY